MKAILFEDEKKSSPGVLWVHKCKEGKAEHMAGEVYITHTEQDRYLHVFVPLP